LHPCHLCCDEIRVGRAGEDLIPVIEGLDEGGNEGLDFGAGQDFAAEVVGGLDLLGEGVTEGGHLRFECIAQVVGAEFFVEVGGAFDGGREEPDGDGFKGVLEDGADLVAGDGIGGEGTFLGEVGEKVKSRSPCPSTSTNAILGAGSEEAWSIDRRSCFLMAISSCR